MRPEGRRKKRIRRGPITIISVLAIVFFIVFLLFPFYWMLLASLKPDADLFNLSENPLSIPHLSLAHYVFLFTQTDFLRWVLNSVIVTFVACSGSLVCSVLGGYSLARLRYPGGGILGWGMFVSYLVPPTLLFLPMTAVVAQLHLLNTLWSLMLVYPTFLIPFSTWLLMGYFKGIPSDLEEAARVDGCSRIQAMIRIAVPLALPGIVSAGIFAFTLSWNEYLYALSFISSGSLMTVPYGVPTELIRNDEYLWGPLMAAALLGAVPVAALYSLFVDKFISGMTGAIKG